MIKVTQTYPVSLLLALSHVTGVAFFTNGRQAPPPARLRHILLRYSLYYNALEANLQYLQFCLRCDSQTLRFINQLRLDLNDIRQPSTWPRTQNNRVVTCREAVSTQTLFSALFNLIIKFHTFSAIDSSI